MAEVLTAEDYGVSLRCRVAQLVVGRGFQTLVVGMIVLNAVTLGLETSAAARAAAGGLLAFIDRAAVLFFTVELALRIYAFRGRFLRDPWAILDLVVVGIAWVPATSSLSVLRALRILRLLRLASVMPSLRNVVEAMLASVPGMASIILLMGMLFYIASVIATTLYGATMPERFGSIGASLFTLFQIMTLESWAEASVRPIMEQHPYAWVFFIPFILVATFVVLNLFLGVIVSSIQTLSGDKAGEDARAAQASSHADIGLVLEQLRGLRAEVAGLQAMVAAGQAPRPPG